MITNRYVIALLVFAALGLMSWAIVLKLGELGIHPVKKSAADFKRLNWGQRIAVLCAIAGLTLFAGLKVHNQVNGDEGGGNGSTNEVQMAVSATIAGGHASALDNTLLDTNTIRAAVVQECPGDIRPVSMPLASPTVEITSSLTERTISAEDIERGVVMTRIGYGETHDFSPPDEADVFTNWRGHGGSTAWNYVAFPDWEMLVRTNIVSSFRVYQKGIVDVAVYYPMQETFRHGKASWCEDVLGVEADNFFAPLKVPAGVVPEGNWVFLDEGDSPSRVWRTVTASNTFCVGWQNILFNRDADKPISFKTEYWPDGHFVFSYDFSRLGIDEVTNILAGVSFGGNAWFANSIPTNVTSMTFWPVNADDLVDFDPDGDGISTIDELFVYHTNPRAADSDYDGISDYDELFVRETNPLDAHSISNDWPDGFALALGGEDPMSFPEGSTNTIYEHIFYSGTTNGVFAYPQSTPESGLLEISVSGTGTGTLVIDDIVVPLIGPESSSQQTMMLRSAPAPAPTNTLLLALDRGDKKRFWFEKPDGLDVALQSPDFMIGVVPAFPYRPGWLAFPHTNATTACIHDLSCRGKTITLVHGEEFEGLAATWSSSSEDVAITNIPPVSATVYGSFRTSQTRPITYTLSHPDALNESPVFEQTLRFCPSLSTNEEDVVTSGLGGGVSAEDETIDPRWLCECSDSVSCSCCSGEWCNCHSWSCPCNANSIPTLPEDDSAEEEAYTNIVDGLQTAQPHTLYLYRANMDAVNLTVPTGEVPRCCPCPEHWGTNHVALAGASSRLRVLDTEGGEFKIAYDNPCVAYVTGVRPSSEFEDSPILFTSNGVTSVHRKYTVLGVRFENESGQPSLDEYNNLSSALGLPLCIGTNGARRIVIKTDVLLTNGQIRVAIERQGEAGRLQVWLPEWEDTHTWDRHSAELMLDSEDRPERYFSLSQWRNLIARYRGSMTHLPVDVVSMEAGRFDLRMDFVSSNGSNYVHDFANQRVTSINPLLLADYNRDGAIDGADIAWWLQGRKFRYWINDSVVEGSCVEAQTFLEEILDTEFGFANWRDGEVNGAYDLINLFPIAVQFDPFLSAWGREASYVIGYTNNVECVNYTFADIPHSQAGTIRTAPHVDILNHSLTNAAMTELEVEGLTNSYDFASQFSANSCLMIAEASETAETALEMSVIVNGKKMFSSILPIKTSSVDDMYRYVSIRGAYENEITDFHNDVGIEEPVNNPDAEVAQKDLFFVHGFNVSENGARRWNREMFKRFWVSGMNARYWGVTWSGDYNFTPVIGYNFNGLHYHRDVRQALMSAPSFKNLVNQYGHDSVVVGHSLGNMVVSEALLKGANASTYVMLDAAVASEAYVPELHANGDDLRGKYVPTDWSAYDKRSWASNWYTWYKNDVNDARGNLGWTGHFASLLNRPGLSVYNFYSPEDEVFEEMLPTPGVFSGVINWPSVDLTFPYLHLNWEFDHYAWQKQETFKGMNAAASLSAGWGFHCWATNINNETVWLKYSAEEANAMVNNGAIRTNAVFDRGVDEMFNYSISEYDIADILAFHIPAVSSPAGKVMTVNSSKSVNLYADCQSNGWGRPSVKKYINEVLTEITPWLHSDIKNMAFYHIHRAFEEIIEKGNLK